MDRHRDFTFPKTISKDLIRYPICGNSKKFSNFIEKELQPFIEKKYKTNKDKIIIGQSLGLLVTGILVTRPPIFNKYFIISPILWRDNGSLVLQDLKLLENNMINIYIAVVTEGLTPTEIPRVMEVDANLLVNKIKNVTNKKVNDFFDYLLEENLATIMHQAVLNAFKALQVN